MIIKTENVVQGTDRNFYQGQLSFHLGSACKLEFGMHHDEFLKWFDELAQLLAELYDQHIEEYRWNFPAERINDVFNALQLPYTMTVMKLEQFGGRDSYQLHPTTDLTFMSLNDFNALPVEIYVNELIPYLESMTNSYFEEEHKDQMVDKIIRLAQFKIRDKTEIESMRSDVSFVNDFFERCRLPYKIIKKDRTDPNSLRLIIIGSYYELKKLDVGDESI